MPRSEFQVLNGRHPVDGGTLYFETDLNALIQEPYNMASAAVFLVLALYWSRALRSKGPAFRWMRQAIVLLWIGAAGGTIYHGFRLHAAFILMDWLPILLLLIIAAWKFWLAWTGGVKAAASALAASFSAQVLGYRLLNAQYALTVGYLLMALSLIVPMVVQVVRHAVLRRPFALALLSFGTALAMRGTDAQGWIPMGSHFLWHLFGAVATHFTLVLVADFIRIQSESLPSKS
jgi:hypothetical protein